MSYKEEMKEVISILDQIIELLNSVSKLNSHLLYYSKLYQSYCKECKYAENEEEANDIRRKILHTYYGGMGSLNDLVLSSGDKILPEDEKYENLRNKLFETLREQL